MLYLAFLSGISLLVTGLLVTFLNRLFKPAFKNVPGPPSPSFETGHFLELHGRNALSVHENLWRQYGRIVRLAGLYGTQELYVSDPAAIHSVCVKDQDIYEETDMFIYGHRLIFGPGLLATLGKAALTVVTLVFSLVVRTGAQHKRQRKVLNPVFSSKHMKAMIPTFYKVTHRVRDAMLAKINYEQGELDMADWVARTSLELIGQAGLGYSFESFEDNNANPYTTAVKTYMGTWFGMSLVRAWVPYLMFGPARLRRMIVDLMPFENVQKMRNIINVMDKTSKEVFYAKKHALLVGDENVAQQVGEGKDLMSVLLRENMAADVDVRMSDDELIGQMSTLIFAAFDTTSSALSRTLYLLAHHPEVQEKLRAEIKDAQSRDGILDYESLSTLPYLDAVCRESLRLHAPIPYQRRVARKDAIMPLSKPIRGIDGNEIPRLYVPKGTHLFIGILAINRDPTIWGKDADEWKPDRWLKPLPNTVTDAHIPGIYSNMMTFLAGGRSCIGFKFSQLEMKVALCTLLAIFSFSPSKRDAYVKWSSAGIQHPYLSTTGEVSLPLVITPVKI